MHIFSRSQMSSLPSLVKLSRSLAISFTGNISGQLLSPASLRIGTRINVKFSSSGCNATRSMIHLAPRLLPIMKIRQSLPREKISDRNQSQSLSCTVSDIESSKSCGSSITTIEGRRSCQLRPRTEEPLPYASIWIVIVCFTPSTSSPV